MFFTLLDRWLAPIDGFLFRSRKAISWILLAANIIPLGLLAFPQWQRNLGSIGWGLLLLLLFVAPLARITGLRVFSFLVSMRRELGILMGTFAFAHAAGYFLNKWASSPLSADFWWYNGLPSALAYGAVALFFTLLLWLTSNTWSMRFLGPKWKKLHRLVYVILVLVALHVIFITGKWFESTAVVVVYAVLKILDMRGFRFVRKTGTTPATQGKGSAV